MKCPFCGSSQIMVVNSRPNVLGSQVWRRRRCTRCHESFTTYEKINLSYLIVVKKSGRRVKYQRAKLFSSIYHSSLDKKNADRGDVGKFSEDVTRLVERDIIKSKVKEIESRSITDLVLKILKRKAPDTFLRFLAYREGEDRKKLKQLLLKYS